jgi:hypothetical protein
VIPRGSATKKWSWRLNDELPDNLRPVADFLRLGWNGARREGFPCPARNPHIGGALRKRSALRERVTFALQKAGFNFDPKNPAYARSRNENSYTIHQLPYNPIAGAGQGLRPTIQVELTYAPLRRSMVMLPVTSFVAEAMKRPPEVPAIACVGVSETAAEKPVSLTRRTAMDLAGASRDPDPALVRHMPSVARWRS